MRNNLPIFRKVAMSSMQNNSRWPCWIRKLLKSGQNSQSRSLKSSRRSLLSWRLSCKCFEKAVVSVPMFHLILNLHYLQGEENGGDNAVKHSLAYIQLEKQNERLKEALIRYVDLCQTCDSICVPNIIKQTSRYLPRDRAGEPEANRRNGT